MSTLSGSKQDARPTRADGGGLPPLHLFKNTGGTPTASPGRVSLPTTEELWRVLETGSLTEQLQQALMKHDVRRALLHDRVPLKRLRRLFSLQLPQQIRLMLMSMVGGMAWFQDLPLADQDSIKHSYRERTSESVSEKSTEKSSEKSTEKSSEKSTSEKAASEKPASETSATKLPKVTPVPIPTPGGTSSHKTMRTFMAKRTGRTTLPPLSSNGSLFVKREESSTKSNPTSPVMTAEEDRQPEAALAKKRAQDSDSSDSSSAPDGNKRQKLVWDADSLSSSISLHTADLMENRHISIESGGSDQEVEIEAESDDSDQGMEVEAEDDSDSENYTPELIVSDIPTLSGADMDIPDAILTAPSGRRYNKWADNNGTLVTTNGALIPDGYKTHSSASMRFPCPIRDCYQTFPFMSGLGHHFSASHNSNLLNDNLDGTLSRVKVANVQGRLGARIISQKAVVSSITAYPDTEPITAPTRRSHKRKEGHKIFTSTPSGRNYINLPVAVQDKDMRDCGFGALFPDGYQKCNYPGNPWICAVRNCRRVFPQLLNLGAHFTRQHRFRQLNDNGDGTLSEIGRHQDSHALVVSQVRRAASELEPLADPAPPLRAPGTSNDSPADTDRSRSSTDGPEQKQLRKSSLAETATSSAGTTPTWEYVKPMLIKHKNGGIPQTGYVSLFAPLPRVRDICWNTAWIKSHPFLDTLPRDVSSLIMQVTGEQSILPCHACRNGRGPYHGCVILPPHAPVELHATTLCCANCLYHCNQAYCTLRESLHDRFGELFPKADMDAERLRMNVPRYESRKPDNGDSGEKNSQSSKGTGKNGLGGSAADKSTISGRRSERIAVRESLADMPVPPVRETRRTASVDPGAPAVPKKVTPIVPPVPPGSSQASSFRSTPTATSTTPVARSPANPVAAPAGTSERLLGDLLEMEDWEVAPGRLQVQRAGRPGGTVRTENVAFSNAFLTTAGQQMVHVDHNISFRIDVVKPGATHVFDADPRATHVCSLASGKLRVRIDDAEFVLGPHGMFQVRPGQRYTVRNHLYVDAYLHVSALRNLP